MFEKKFIRTTGEIRFRPTLGSTRNPIDFGKKIENKFPHWKIQNARDVSLYDDKKNTLIQFRYNGIFFLNEGEETNDKFIGFIDEVYKDIVEDGNVSEFQHVGCRRRCIYESKLKIQDLTDLTYRKFYGNSGALKEIAGDTIRDTLFVLDSTNGDVMMKSQIGPSLSSQAGQFFDSQFQEVSLLEDKSYLLVDVDTFKSTDINKENSLDTLRELEAVNLRTVKAYIDYLSSK